MVFLLVAVFILNYLFDNDIRMLKWFDLIENIKRKLQYMANLLENKDDGVQEKAQKDFADIEFNKVSSSLKRVAI